jgi:hypothetical protein
VDNQKGKLGNKGKTATKKGKVIMPEVKLKLNINGVKDEIDEVY